MFGFGFFLNSFELLGIGSCSRIIKVGGGFWRSFGPTSSYVPGLPRKPYNLHRTVTLCPLLSDLGVLKEPFPHFLHWSVTCLDLEF